VRPAPPHAAGPATRPLVLVVTSSTASFLNHRIGVVREAQRRGYRVALIASDLEGQQAAVLAEDVAPVVIRGGGRGVDPVGDLAAAWQIARYVSRERPAVVHAAGLKSMFLVALARAFVRLPRTVTTVTGLGAIYISDSLRNRLIRGGVEQVLRTLLWRRNVVTVFQNGDDHALFLSRGVVPAAGAVLIRGSGVDIEQFPVTEEIPTDDPVVVFPARLLASKGVREFVEAARLLRARGVAGRFALVGGVDPVNPDALSQAEIDAAASSGAIEHWGFRADMPAVLAGCAVVCLPSYREGVPKALIEAASMGRAVISTDVPGCREIVRHGETGLLAPVRDAAALADALQTVLVDPALRRRFGLAGRRLVETEFALTLVAGRTVDLYAG